MSSLLRYPWTAEETGHIADALGTNPVTGNDFIQEYRRRSNDQQHSNIAIWARTRVVAAAFNVPVPPGVRRDMNALSRALKQKKKQEAEAEARAEAVVEAAAEAEAAAAAADEAEEEKREVLHRQFGEGDLHPVTQLPYYRETPAGYLRPVEVAELFGKPHQWPAHNARNLGLRGVRVHMDGKPTTLYEENNVREAYARWSTTAQPAVKPVLPMSKPLRPMPPTTKPVAQPVARPVAPVVPPGVPPGVPPKTAPAPVDGVARVRAIMYALECGVLTQEEAFLKLRQL